MLGHRDRDFKQHIAISVEAHSSLLSTAGASAREIVFPTQTGLFQQPAILCDSILRVLCFSICYCTALDSACPVENRVVSPSVHLGDSVPALVLRGSRSFP